MGKLQPTFSSRAASASSGLEASDAATSGPSASVPHDSADDDELATPRPQMTHAEIVVANGPYEAQASLVLNAFTAYDGAPPEEKAFYKRALEDVIASSPPMVHTITPSQALVHERNRVFHEASEERHRQIVAQLQETLQLVRLLDAERPEALAAGGGGGEEMIARLVERAAAYTPRPLREWFKKISIAVVDEVVEVEDEEDEDEEDEEWVTENDNDAGDDEMGNNATVNAEDEVEGRA
ncbi:uncharacterized protein LOC62_01G000054 [Vanrija pseudolonga]|uniref:Uncharacterized protein n=1 Tax=Vanrija pseudolonga TaxID=143232 RepID=A0AAF0Y4A8_9TREE|nr:hypothetical protein LOC62_01G000054 [Vanrija pseudolonga]